MIEIESDAVLYSKATTLIEDIFRFRKEKAQDLSLLETMIEYSHQKDIPLQEIGNTIADNKDYVEIFRKTLAKDGYFRMEDDLFDEIEMLDEEW
jgi:ribosome-interacting GTPase 1